MELKRYRLLNGKCYESYSKVTKSRNSYIWELVKPSLQSCQALNTRPKGEIHSTLP